jgi:hypothetical protein
MARIVHRLFSLAGLHFVRYIYVVRLRERAPQPKSKPVQSEENRTMTTIERFSKVRARATQETSFVMLEAMLQELMQWCDGAVDGEPVPELTDEEFIAASDAIDAVVQRAQALQACLHPSLAN